MDSILSIDNNYHVNYNKLIYCYISTANGVPCDINTSLLLDELFLLIKNAEHYYI